jgi:Putative adhesin
MRNAPSLSVMNKHTPRGLFLSKHRPDWLSLWALLGLGMLLMLAAALAGAEEAAFTAKHMEHFNATLSSRSTVRIENVSGNIVASPGKEFSAVVTTTVTAPSQSRADEALRKVRIVQGRDDDEFSLETHWPDSREFSFSEQRQGRRRVVERCRGCKVTTRYEIVIPPGVKTALRTVNGEVQTRDLDGELDLHSVNGSVRASGTRHSVAAQTVNGKVEIVAQAFPAEASADLQTINGSITLTLPKNARFDLAASTTNGAIASTFPLPPRAEAPESEKSARKPEKPGEPRARVARPLVVRHDGDDVVVDVEALQKELEESMNQVDVEVRDSLRGVNRELRRLKIFDIRREYSGSVGQGGGKVRLATLNGSITLLASGTDASEVRSLVPERQRFAVTIPQIRVRVPKTIVRVPPHAVIAPPEPEESVVRGDVAGDFLATSGGGTYRIGKVSGTVKILTHSGEIHVASAGAGADLKTYGGDIQIGPVNGDLRAQTLAGDVRAGAVAGSITVETSGGDIRVERVGGSAGARTGGGDIILPSVRGGIEAQTGGGDVRVGIFSREVKGGVTIRNSGGDVTLTLPADFRGEVDLEVHDSDPDETLIRSEFPEIAVTRQHGSQRAAGALNGGGPKVLVRTQSGSIRLRKGPPAGNP